MGIVDHQKLFQTVSPLLLARTGTLKKSDGRLMAFCPIHDDGAKAGYKEGQSLSLHPKFGLQCFACGEDKFWDILKALGLDKKDILNGNAAPTATARRNYPLVSTYDYCSTDGTLLAQKGRFQAGADKYFSWRLPNAPNWNEGLKRQVRIDDMLWGAEIVAQLPEDQEVWFTEGEKAASAIRSMGGTGVCHGGGAAQNKFGVSLDVLKGRHVILWPDNDEPGIEFMQRVEKVLLDRVKPASIKWVDITGMPLGAKEDAHEWYSAMKNLSDVLFIKQITLEANKPVYDGQAEVTVLAAMLNETTALELAAYVNKDDFYVLQHQVVVEAISDLMADGVAIDPVTVCNKLERSGKIAQAGGRLFIDELEFLTPSIEVAVSSNEIVRKDAGFRRLARAGELISSLGKRMTGEVDDAYGEAESILFNVRSNNGTIGDAAHIAEILSSDWPYVSDFAANPNQIGGIPSGYPILDRTLNGFEQGRLYTIAGATGNGKSMFAANLTVRMAEAGYPVLFFATEMSAKQVVRRMLFGKAEINRVAQAKSHQPLTQNQLDDLKWAYGKLEKLPIYIHDLLSNNIETICAAYRRMAKTKDVQICFIDHIDLIHAGTGNDPNRHREMSYIYKRLKMTARDLDLPLVSMSQLSRGIEQRKNPYPQLSDLRESGSKEEDSDVVLFIHRPWKYDHNQDEKDFQIIIAKNRDGESDRGIQFWGEVGTQTLSESSPTAKTW